MKQWHMSDTFLTMENLCFGMRFALLLHSASLYGCYDKPSKDDLR
mgnify:CR=1 FL=1